MRTEKEVNDLFNKSTPPDFVLPEEKARLRRELLNSSHFKTNSAPGRVRTFQLRYVLGAGVALALAAVLIVMSLTPDRISARELVRDIREVYEQADIAGKVHHLRFIFKTADREAFVEEKWVYPVGGKVRVLHREAETGEVLGHTIVDGEHTYGLENSQFKVKYNIENSGQPAVTRPLSERQTIRRTQSILIKPAPGQKTTSDGKRIMQAYIMTDAFSYDAFERQSPRELVSNLVASAKVDYLGSEFDELTGGKLDVLTKRSQARSFSLKLEFPEDRLAEVGWFCERLESDDISLFMDSPELKFLDEKEISSESAWKTVEAVETIKVFPESRRIRQVNLSIREDGTETYRAEKTFLADEYMDYSESLFDPERYGLKLRSSEDQERKEILGFDKNKFLKR